MQHPPAKPAISRLSDIVDTGYLTLKFVSKRYRSFSTFGENETIATSPDTGDMHVNHDVSVS